MIETLRDKLFDLKKLEKQILVLGALHPKVTSNLATSLLEGKTGEEVDRFSPEYFAALEDIVGMQTERLKKGEPLLEPAKTKKPKKTKATEIAINDAPQTVNTNHNQTKHSIKSIIESYLVEKEVEEALTEKSKQLYVTSFSILVEILGDIAVEDVAAQEARKLKEVLLQYPKNRTKIAAIKGLTIKQVLSKQSELDYTTISVTTVNKHISRVSSLFEWCQFNGYINQNLFAKLRVKQKKTESLRDGFTDEEIKRIFDPKGLFAELEKVKHKESYYWITLVGLYTGARLNEICQLHIDDLKSEKGVWYFDLNEDGDDKKLKNTSSKRQIPVHKDLIELGLLSYQARLKKNDTVRLFPELTRDRDGYTRAVSKWFNAKYLPAIKVKTAKNNFHSFRHSFANHFKQKAIKVDFVAEVLGHSNNSMSYGVYADRLKVEVLQDEVMQHLDFDIDVEGLKTSF